MFGSKKKLEDLMEQLRPDLTREALGVGPEFPGVAPNPVLSSAARRRNAELRTGELAIGRLVDWREVSSDGGVRVVLMLDVDTVGGVSFRGIADESLTVTELVRLAPGQLFPVRHRPAVRDHYVAVARDVGAEQTQALVAEIARRATA
ncbi:MAG: hypothetical protein J7484_00845 [Microbacterium sp.]|nr:hypothetical protein [Microbacterium sp.]